MSDSNKANRKESHQKKPQKPIWRDMIIDGKGTVAEPWPTAEQLWNDPDVQNEIKEIKEMRAAFKKIRNTEYSFMKKIFKNKVNFI